VTEHGRGDVAAVPLPAPAAADGIDATDAVGAASHGGEDWAGAGSANGMQPVPMDCADLSAHTGPATDVTSGQVPNVARMYDFLLGGKDNYEMDRKAAELLLAAVPDAAVAARENRKFLGRAVKFLVREAGIRQFIDIGTGLPARGNVHAVAHEIAPETRVAYVDNDPVVIAHANALLSGGANVATIKGDLRNLGGIIANPALRSLIDFGEPVAVLLVAILHFIADAERPQDIVRELKAVIAPGSYLVISHVTDEQVSSVTAEQVRKLYDQANAPGVARSRKAIVGFFDGLEMIPPGLVSVTQWRPESSAFEPGRTIFYAGAGTKR
jgi:hypothetical protein